MADDTTGATDQGPQPAQAGGDTADESAPTSAPGEVAEGQPASGDEQTPVAPGTAPTPTETPSDEPSPAPQPATPVLHEGRAPESGDDGGQA